MSESNLIDHEHRERFSREWSRNFAVSANAGSGKTTAISERLAAIALTEGGGAILRKTAVVTFTKKAANQIGQRARGVLMQQLTLGGRKDLTALDHLERAFFGTIHSFCLKLAQTYGQDLGVILNPTVLSDEEESVHWEEFLEQDGMVFPSVTGDHLAAFIRHVPMAAVFDLAREMDGATSKRFRAKSPGLLAGPDELVLEEILAVVAKQKRSLGAVQENQRIATDWCRRYREENSFLPLPKPLGTASGMPELYGRLFAPVKSWLADVAAALAAELAERYRSWRFERGFQTYADQIEAAMNVLRSPEILDRIRAEGWRIILDEAQDTDPQQFAILVEVAREPGAELGTWPGSGEAPRAGHFCMVGDGQQSIYGNRADVSNFMRHVEAFRNYADGDLLQFEVTFRAPESSIDALNATLPDTFGPGRIFNVGLAHDAGAPGPILQVPYVPLAAGPKSIQGLLRRITLTLPEPPPSGVDAWLLEEVRQIADLLTTHGPRVVGANSFGEICLLAPRNDWLITARKALETAGLKVALQMRKNRNGDIPIFAWMTGLLTVVCDPENTFEWVGVLREVFDISDASIAIELREKGRFIWEEPEAHPEPMAMALHAVRPFVLQANDEGVALAAFAEDLSRACELKSKATAIDQSGNLSSELDRLLAQAATLGLEGAGPRDWLGVLLAEIEGGKPTGKPTPDALNLLTSYSAKGLEWPVVIPIGLWRACEKAPEQGLRVVRDQLTGARIYFDTESMPVETKESRERERLRELVRLLYVTLTRARRSLILPWAEGFGGKPRGQSLGGLWGADLTKIPELEVSDNVRDTTKVTGVITKASVSGLDEKEWLDIAPWPQRVLPHRLANHIDLPRGLRHESGADEPTPIKPGLDPIDYGLWWHETMEFLPWGGDGKAVADYADRAFISAEQQGFIEQGKTEWALMLRSAAWIELCNKRWIRSAELGIFAPLHDQRWIDGVMDLVLHDPIDQWVWVVDWKTNRKRPLESDWAHLQRLIEEYSPQLNAYGRCLQALFPGCRVRKWIYASASGIWGEVEDL
uniref:UvrD-helicase domain-containing protein n=1 Tax=Cephaloticoccus sp. TaxID=1985742 RepID=UPI00404B7359